MKILIADDELVSRIKLDRFIRNLGHETLVATDGTEAWEIWKNERPRMVITDWMMPGINGIDLCSKIRDTEGSQYTFIIMVTSKGEVDDIVLSISAGADDFIRKPFVKEELRVRIKAGERVLGFISRDIVIFSLAKLAESRDSETGDHLERIRFYSKAIAETMANSDAPPEEIDNLFIDNIFLTSPMHDIGKIGIPDYILLKPKQLDDTEYAIMKNHCQIGFETLNDCLNKYPRAEYLQMAAEIALSHHEKYDGTGYPNGLKGEEIPLSARIVALSDVYDALVSKRVYKKTLSHEIAKAIIIDNNNKHFDPKVVDAFLSCEEMFVEISNRFKNS